MLSGALETYAAALVVIGASISIGAGVLAACGWRHWSWTAPPIGLAAATVLAWWAIRLPGHGITALIVLAVAAALGAALAVRRLDGLGAALTAGLPVAGLALLGGLIPFVVEGHFGVLGTGFNVDMSQHLFAASWLSDPRSWSRELRAGISARPAFARRRHRRDHRQPRHLLQRGHDCRPGSRLPQRARRGLRLAALAGDAGRRPHRLRLPRRLLSGAGLVQGALRGRVPARLRLLARPTLPKAVAAVPQPDGPPRSRARCSAGGRSTPTAPRGSPGRSVRWRSGR